MKGSGSALPTAAAVAGIILQCCRKNVASLPISPSGFSTLEASQGLPRRLQSGEIGVEVSDGLDAAEVVFEGNVLIGGVRVLVG